MTTFAPGADYQPSADGRSAKMLARFRKKAVSSGGGSTQSDDQATGLDVTRAFLALLDTAAFPNGLTLDPWPAVLTALGTATFPLRRCPVFFLHGDVGEAGPAGARLAARYYAGASETPADADFLPLAADGSDCRFPCDRAGVLWGDDVLVAPLARVPLLVRVRLFALPL